MGRGQKEIQPMSNEPYNILTLPGKCLDISELVNKKKKKGVLRIVGIAPYYTMKDLEENNFFKIVVKNSKGSIKGSFHS